LSCAGLFRRTAKTVFCRDMILRHLARGRVETFAIASASERGVRPGEYP